MICLWPFCQRHVYHAPRQRDPPKHDDAPLVLTSSKSVEQKQMKDIVQLLISALLLLPFLALSSS
jgi:hypothetical protein